MKNRKKNHDNWATPPHILEGIRKEFGEYFDPCPWNHDMSWHGLQVAWKEVNFVNPPYNLTEKAAFVERAIKHQFQSIIRYTSICLLPVSTSTKLFHDWIENFRKEKIRFIQGRLRFIGINDKGQYVNYDQIQVVTKETIEYNDPEKGLIEVPKFIRQSGQFDSMIVIF